MSISKRQANSLLKSLDTILNLKNLELIETIFSMRLEPSLKHNLTEEKVNQFFLANTHLNEFEILDKLFSEIIFLNPNNNSGLFSIYGLLAQKAKNEGNLKYMNYAKLTYKYYALRQLNSSRDSSRKSLYINVICRSSDMCNQCQHLDNMVFSESEFLNELPIPVEKCTSDYLCSACLTAIDENVYERLKNRNEIF